MDYIKHGQLFQCFKCFNISFKFVKQILLPQEKHGIDEFFLIRLMLEWSEKNCFVHFVPWSASKMLLSQNTWVGFFPGVFSNIYIMFVKISGNSQSSMIVLFPFLIIVSLLLIWSLFERKGFIVLQELLLVCYTIPRNIRNI